MAKSPAAKSISDINTGIVCIIFSLRFCRKAKKKNVGWKFLFLFLFQSHESISQKTDRGRVFLGGDKDWGIKRKLIQLMSLMLLLPLSQLVKSAGAWHG